jgi:hypothetical protein
MGNLETIAAFVALLVVVTLALMRRATPTTPPEEFVNLLETKPVLWWIVDVEPNSRSWLDFGGRKTSEPNRGYLQVTLNAVKKTQGNDFDVRPLIGREAILAQIPAAPPQAAELPPALWRRYAVAALLDAQGGLVMDGASTLCVGPSLAPFVKGVDAAAFGITADEPVADAVAAAAPGPAPYVAWAAAPHHPAWAHATAIWTKLVERGPQAWTSAEARRSFMTVFEAQKGMGLRVIREAEAGRLADGRPRALEDLFGRVAEPADPKTVLTPGAAYVSYDGDDLARRYEFNWFLRLSANQIASSDFVWARLASLSG